MTDRYACFYYKIISDNNHGCSRRGPTAHEDLQGDQLLRGGNLQAIVRRVDVERIPSQLGGHHSPGSSREVEDHQADPNELRLQAQGQDDFLFELPQQ